MPNLKRMTFLAVFFVVILRMVVGWQMFYEGLWKYGRVGTSQEWSAAGYLKNAQGPLRDRFRSLVDDPDDLNWLDFDKVDQRWSEWETQFTAYYELSAEQTARLDRIVTGPKTIAGKSRLPEVPQRKLIGGTLEREKIIVWKQDKRGWFLVVDGRQHLTPRERDRLVRGAKKIEQQHRQEAKSADDPDKKKTAERQANLVEAFQRAVKDVYKRQTKLSFQERLAVLLKGDPERVTQIRKDQAPGSVDHQRQGQIDEYRTRLERYNEMAANVRQNFQQDHLQLEWKRIRELHSELVGPVKKLEQDMQTAARKILTEEQIDKGWVAVSPPGQIARINQMTMWALMVIGLLLIIGLFSRLSAFAGGVLILSFYLVLPPWPGVPQPLGPEHSLIVNKNLIEVLALFALAFIPSGKLFGVDSLLIGLFGGGKNGPRKSSNVSTLSITRESSKKLSKKTPLISPAENIVQANPTETLSASPSAMPTTTPSVDTYTILPEKKKRSKGKR